MTGKSSNRATLKKTREKLDPTKVIAIHSSSPLFNFFLNFLFSLCNKNLIRLLGAFEFWATKMLAPPYNPVNVQHYRTQIPTYIGKFCDDLKQPPHKRKKRVGEDSYYCQLTYTRSSI